MDDKEIIEAVDSSQYSTVANILASSFYDDPVINWYIRQDEEKKKALEDLFLTSLNKYYASKIVYKDNNSQCCSIWIDSNDLPSGLSLGLKLQFIYRVYTWTKFNGISRFLKVLEKQEENHPKEPHHYLYLIGVRPESQGKGLGSKMLLHHLDLLDQLGVPAYLENSNQLNVKFYQRYGFEQINEIRLEERGPIFWGMWREPKE